MALNVFIDTETFPNHNAGHLQYVATASDGSGVQILSRRSDEVIRPTGYDGTTANGTTGWIPYSGAGWQIDSKTNPGLNGSTIRFFGFGAPTSVSAVGQRLDKVWFGALGATAGKYPSKPEDFIKARINGVLSSSDFYIWQMDRDTWDAIKVAQTAEEAISAMRNFTYMSLLVYAPGYTVTAGFDPVNVSSNAVFSLEFQFGDDSVFFNNPYIGQGTYKEAETISPPLYKEMAVELYKPIFKEIETIPAPLYKEIQAKVWDPVYKEFEPWAPPLYMEFEAFTDTDLSDNITSATASGDCGTVSFTIDTDNYTPSGGEELQVSISRGNTVVPVNSHQATATGWSFDTTEDGVYNVRITSNKSGVIANRYYFYDCRTLKCISRIAKADTDAEMQGACKGDPDWKLIYALWYAAKNSYQVANYAAANEAFDALKLHCRECNEVRCGCK